MQLHKQKPEKPPIPGKRIIIKRSKYQKHYEALIISEQIRKKGIQEEIQKKANHAKKERNYFRNRQIALMINPSLSNLETNVDKLLNHLTTPDVRRLYHK